MDAIEVLEVYVQGKGISEITLVELPTESRVRDIIGAAQPHGLQVVEDEELLIWLEGEEEPLRLELTLGEAGIRRHDNIHVHTCHRITAAVVYNGQTKTRHFSPAQTIEKVKQWACHEFGLSETDAAEHILLISGTNDEPADNIHIGTLAHPPHCSVSFDLVPAKRIQG